MICLYTLSIVLLFLVTHCLLTWFATVLALVIIVNGSNSISGKQIYNTEEFFYTIVILLFIASYLKETMRLRAWMSGAMLKEERQGFMNAFDQFSERVIIF
jgi:hypothetical protein